MFKSEFGVSCLGVPDFASSAYVVLLHRVGGSETRVVRDVRSRPGVA